MNVRRTDDFIADIERQFEWYTVNAGSVLFHELLADELVLRDHCLTWRRG